MISIFRKRGTKFSLLFILITGLGFFLYYWEKNGTSFGWQIYNVFGVASAFALAIIAFLGYLKYIKEEDVILIKFSYKEEHEKKDQEGNIPTGLTTLRKNCNRAEIQGLLGMIFNNYHNKNRYDLNHFQHFKEDNNVLQIIDDAQTGKRDDVVIDITEEELKQFNVL